MTVAQYEDGNSDKSDGNTESTTVGVGLTDMFSLAPILPTNV